MPYIIVRMTYKESNHNELNNKATRLFEELELPELQWEQWKTCHEVSNNKDQCHNMVSHHQPNLNRHCRI